MVRVRHFGGVSSLRSAWLPCEAGDRPARGRELAVGGARNRVRRCELRCASAAVETAAGAVRAREDARCDARRFRRIVRELDFPAAAGRVAALVFGFEGGGYRLRQRGGFRACRAAD